MPVGIVPAIVAIIFAGIGWAMAQERQDLLKFFFSIATICLPVTVIWWALELIDWPPTLIGALTPFVYAWAPCALGMGVHQLRHIARPSRQN